MIIKQNYIELEIEDKDEREIIGDFWDLMYETFDLVSGVDVKVKVGENLYTPEEIRRFNQFIRDIFNAYRI